MAGRYHIIIDVKNVATEKLADKAGIEQFLTTLPGKIGMKVLYGPVVIEGVPENPGVTAFVIIDFSHISMHTFTNSGQALVDIFSCKPYSQEEATNLTLDFLEAKKEDAMVKEVYWEQET